jgi:hypothetical protein
MLMHLTIKLSFDKGVLATALATFTKIWVNFSKSTGYPVNDRFSMNQ